MASHLNEIGDLHDLKYVAWKKIIKLEYLNFTVEELLWGYEDPSLKKLKDLEMTSKSRNGFFIKVSF